MLFGLKIDSESLSRKNKDPRLLTNCLAKTKQKNKRPKICGNGNTGLNQFPVRNENYQRNTMKPSISTLKYISLLFLMDLDLSKIA